MRQHSRLAVLLLALAGAATSSFPAASAVETQPHTSGHRPADARRTHLAYWTAVSTTAMGITGDVEVGEQQIIIDDKHRYRIAEVRNLTASEVEEANSLTGSRTLKVWTIYKIDISATTRLRNGNRICGNRSATKVIMAQGTGYGTTELSLIFWSGSREPFFKGWRDSHNGVCGSFGYMPG